MAKFNTKKVVVVEEDRQIVYDSEVGRFDIRTLKINRNYNSGSKS